ncbi:hypothetical protein ACFQV2_19340 [Actinokineospora soli]|uniref:PH domain-containing protein n=1 Tax=Actinokineospora soli TaxID=1048753 RepID=A0ABW2TQZ2_9PSEU
MSAVGARFVADVDLVAWRGRVVPWLAGVAAVVVGGVVLLVAGVPLGVVAVVVVLVGAVPVAKVAVFVAQRRRRESPLSMDAGGVWVPTAQGPAFLPWETVREVVVDGPTLRFRVRAGVTPQTEGAGDAPAGCVAGGVGAGVAGGHAVVLAGCGRGAGGGAGVLRWATLSDAPPSEHHSLG